MNHSTAAVICNAQTTLGESPVWHVGEQALYFVDIVRGHLHRYHPAAGTHTLQDLGVVTGAVGQRAAGGWVMATTRGFALLDAGAAEPHFVGDPDADEAEDTRFNDGKVDPQGRFWAGKMSGAPVNGLYRLDPDGGILRMEDGIQTSNGLGWSPDGATMYYTDSHQYAIFAYDFDGVRGTISNRRVFARAEEGGGSPDGLAVDVEGCVWSARWQGGTVVRYLPNGRVDGEIHLPVSLVTSCAFGGPQLEDLYITSAAEGFDEARRQAEPLAGDVFCASVGVKGLEIAMFLG